MALTAKCLISMFFDAIFSDVYHAMYWHRNTPNGNIVSILVQHCIETRESTIKQDHDAVDRVMVRHVFDINVL